MKIQESAENYLETILIITERNGSCRSIDIANELGYSKPSVSRAVKLLGNDGCIKVDDDGYITLTEKGMDIATQILDRHKIIESFLLSIGVDEFAADEDACRIEHVISDKTFKKLKAFMDTQSKE